MNKSPDAFRTISEVADWLGTPTHVLRFWESRFSQIKPVKRAGGRRYYRPSDMALLGGIRKLLHEEGLTIRGVQKILREKGVKHVASLSPPIDGEDASERDSEEAGFLADVPHTPQSADVVELRPGARQPAPAAEDKTGDSQPADDGAFPFAEGPDPFAEVAEDAAGDLDETAGGPPPGLGHPTPVRDEPAPLWGTPETPATPPLEPAADDGAEGEPGTRPKDDEGAPGDAAAYAAAPGDAVLDEGEQARTRPPLSGDGTQETGAEATGDAGAEGSEPVFARRGPEGAAPTTPQPQQPYDAAEALQMPEGPTIGEEVLTRLRQGARLSPQAAKGFHDRLADIRARLDAAGDGQ